MGLINLFLSPQEWKGRPMIQDDIGVNEAKLRAFIKDPPTSDFAEVHEVWRALEMMIDAGGLSGDIINIIRNGFYQTFPWAPPLEGEEAEVLDVSDDTAAAWQAANPPSLPPADIVPATSWLPLAEVDEDEDASDSPESPLLGTGDAPPEGPFSGPAEDALDLSTALPGAELPAPPPPMAFVPAQPAEALAETPLEAETPPPPPPPSPAFVPEASVEADDEFQPDLEAPSEERQDATNDEEGTPETVSAPPAQDDQALEPQAGEFEAEEEAAPEEVVADEPAEASVEGELAETAEADEAPVAAEEVAPETVAAGESSEEVLVLDEPDEALAAARTEVAVLTAKLAAAQASADVFKDLAQKGVDNLKKLPTKEEMLAHFADLKEQIAALPRDADLHEKVDAMTEAISVLETEIGKLKPETGAQAPQPEPQPKPEAETENQETRDMESQPPAEMTAAEKAKQKIQDDKKEAKETRMLSRAKDLVVQQTASPSLLGWWILIPPFFLLMWPFVPRKGWAENTLVNYFRWPLGIVLNVFIWSMLLYGATNAVHNVLPDEVFKTHVTTPMLAAVNPVDSNDGAEMKIRGLESERDELTATLTRMVMESDRLERQLAGLTEERDGLIAEKEALVIERDGLQTDLDAAREEVGEFGPILTEIRAERDGVIAERDGVIAERDDLVIERDQAREELRATLERAAQLASSLADARIARDAAQAESLESGTSLSIMTVDRDRLQGLLDRANELNTQLRNSLSGVVVERDAILSAIEEIPVLTLPDDGRVSIGDGIAPAGTTDWQIGRIQAGVEESMEGVSLGFKIVNFYRNQAEEREEPDYHYLSNMIVRVAPATSDE